MRGVPLMSRFSTLNPAMYPAMCPVMCTHPLAVALQQTAFKEAAEGIGKAAALMLEGFGF